MDASDPWGLLKNGECRDRSFAFFTICITEVETVLQSCLASLCALLATTDPSCVVAYVSRWVYQNARDALLRNGVLAVLAPEWAPVHETHPYAHLPNRAYTFTKLEAFRLTQYARVATFDADVLFMRNASSLQEVSSFAAARVPKGKDPAVYVNTGVMVLEPSQSLYSALVEAWREGRYALHFADTEHTEQDVIIELCILRNFCGRVTDLDACTYNHGAWLPKPLGRTCPRGGVVARHNFMVARERFLAGSLQTAFYRGNCRPRANPEVDLKACWAGEYTSERCCRKDMVWGDPQCWGHGLSFERCCGGGSGFPRDAERIGKELRYAGNAWYGLSSQPEPLPNKFLDSLCLRRYRPIRHTLAGMTSVMTLADDTPWYSREAWDANGPPPNQLMWGIKCKALRALHLREETATFVMFRFRMLTYFLRHLQDPVVAQLHASYMLDHRFQASVETMTACVPHECCMNLPEGTNASLSGLRSVLWSFLTEFILSLRRWETVPAPEPEDFEEIYEIDPEDPGAKWKLCNRS